MATAKQAALRSGVYWVGFVRFDDIAQLGGPPEWGVLLRESDAGFAIVRLNGQISGNCDFLKIPFPRPDLVIRFIWELPACGISGAVGNRGVRRK